jgi:hypothetical protein
LSKSRVNGRNGKIVKGVVPERNVREGEERMRK